MLIPLVSRRTYDFSLTAGSAFDVVVVRHLDVVAYRSAALIVRVHSLNFLNGVALDVVAYRASPSCDAPETDFVGTTALVTAAVNKSGVLLCEPLTAKFGSHLQVRLHATPRVTPNTFVCALSIAVNLTEEPG